jgi:hypothetical protein
MKASFQLSAQPAELLVLVVYLAQVSQHNIYTL